MRDKIRVKNSEDLEFENGQLSIKEASWRFNHPKIISLPAPFFFE